MLSALRIVALAALLSDSGFAGSALAQAADGFHQLVLYISEADAAQMNGVLDIAANVSRHYSGLGEEVEIEIVAYAEGLHMLRDDTSPVKQRLGNFMQSMVNVTFQACGNTLDTMERNEGARPSLIEGVSTVQTGVAHLMQRSEEGWTLVRP
jgi:intracellular sulfur oxidation DsrE/DsrF family protein